MDLWIKKETFLHRDTGVTEHSSYFIPYFTWSPYILTVARISFPNFKFFEKFVEDLLRVSNIVVKSSSSIGICLKKENLYIVDNFFWMFIVFFPKLNSMFLRMINSTLSSTSVWYRDTWLSVNSCWMLLSFLQI